MQVTGLNAPVFVGQSIPNFGSVWQIPDQQLRFIGDMVVCVGRIGLPLLGALFAGFLNPIQSFANYMIAVGILGIWVCSVMMIRIISITSNFLNDKKDYFISWRSNSGFVVLITSFTLAPWATIYVLEGTLTQLWLLAATLWQVKLILSELIHPFYQKNGFVKNTILFSLAPVFVSVVYPNGIPLFFMATVFPFVLHVIFSKYDYKNRFYSIASMAIGNALIIPWAYFLLKNSYKTLVNMVITGTSGSPYNLAVSRLTDLLPIIGNHLQFVLPSAPGLGFQPLESSIQMASSILIANLVLIILALIMSANNLKKLMKMLILSALPIFLLFQPLQMLFHPEKFHPYIFARFLCNYITLGFPVLLGIIFSVFLFRKMLDLTNKYQLFFIAFIGMISTFNFAYMTANFINVTQKINIIDDPRSFTSLDPEASIFLTDSPDQRITSLALLGKLYYLTDTWQPILRQNPGMPTYRNVYYIDVKEFPAKFTKIGKIKIEIKNSIKGPITYKEIFSKKYFIKEP